MKKRRNPSYVSFTFTRSRFFSALFSHTLLPNLLIPPVYAKLPDDISDRWVLLLDPMLGELQSDQISIFLFRIISLEYRS